MSGSTHLFDKCFSVLSYLSLYHIYLVCFSTHTTTCSTHHFVWRCLTGPHWPWHFTWIYGSADDFDQSYFTTSYLLTHKQSMAEHARVLSIVLVTSMDYSYGVFVRVRSPRSRVIHGFVTEPWYSPHVLFSCERARLRLCSSRALSRLRTLFRVGAWCSDPGTHVLRFGFRVWVRTLALHFLSLCKCAASSSLDCALSCPCVFCCVARSCVHSCYILCCVARSLYIHWLHAFMLSCLVWTRGLWLFSLAACSCLVLHMAGDVCWPCACVFCFVWARGFCPSFLCAMCSHVNLSWPHPSCYLFID